MTPPLSIVIPTYNRRETLLKVLEAYKRQTAAGEILELLVVDDGSTDGTQEAVAQASAASSFPICCLCQMPGGQAAARNRGIRESLGKIILFNDDDIIPSPNYAAEHLAWHEKYPDLPDAVLGKLIWSPEINPTPFMRWLEQESYGRLGRGLLREPLLLSGLSSVKREFLLQNGAFDEEFKGYGFEDIELGERLKKRGLRVLYNPDAVACHYKKVFVADVWRREELVQKALPLFRAKVGAVEGPDPFRSDSTLKKSLRKLVRAVLPIAAPITRLFDTQIRLPGFIYRVFHYHYIVPTAKAGARVNTGSRKQPVPIVHGDERREIAL